jgi:acyl-homoserine lactone acylase PvdQ
VLTVTLVAALGAAPSTALATRDDSGTALDVLPPGEWPSGPSGPHATDQVALYDGLTPLFDRVGPADLRRYFKSEKLGANGSSEQVITPRPGVTIRVDAAYGVPHVFGATRYDVLFGSGYATALVRGVTYLQSVRSEGRAVALDAPTAVDPNPATMGQTLSWSPQVDEILNRQRALLLHAGAAGRQVLADDGAYAAGINAYLRDHGASVPPWTLADTVAGNAFLAKDASGGGAEVTNAMFLNGLQRKLGRREGLAVFRDLRSVNDPEAPVTANVRFPYEGVPQRPTPGSPPVDNGSFVASNGGGPLPPESGQRSMSTAILVAGSRSTTGHPAAVMGPQLGYSYPANLIELDLEGGGIQARGAVLAGEPYVLIGRGASYAYSTTLNHFDQIDQYLDKLCEPGGRRPTRSSTHYWFRGRCRPMMAVDLGTLRPSATVVTFNETVHGPVYGTVTVHGRLYAVTRRRSTRGREAVLGLPLSKLDAGQVHSGRDFVRTMSGFEGALNWLYLDGRDIAYYSSGRVPLRPPAVDPSLAALGTGQYEWRGFLGAGAHPYSVNPRDGILRNWNNKSAPGFGAADNYYAWGAVQRVTMFRGFRRHNSLARLVAIMNRAATEDFRVMSDWPVIERVLGKAAPDALSRAAVKLVSQWRREGGSRLDRTGNGRITAPGAAVLDQAWTGIADAVLEPRLGHTLTTQLATQIIPQDEPPSTLEQGQTAPYNFGWYGYVSKDLRTLLGERVPGPYHERYCGAGNLQRCRASLWAAIRRAAQQLAATESPDPNQWWSSATAERIQFEPAGSLPVTMRYTNRSVFEQVIDFTRHGRRAR